MGSRYAVPLSELERVHVPVEEQVTEQEVTPPIPDLTDEQERERLMLLRIGGAAY